MHELSIAMGIVDMAEEHAARLNGARILAVHLKIGQLTGIVEEALRSSYALAAHDTVLDKATLVIEEVPVGVHCPRCDATRPVRSMQAFCCAVCGAPAASVVHGRELMVTALEVET
jgi:hydrogenase nickel incorporation protein HypA/HybF